MKKLFVYGSLGLGGPNEHILKDIGGEFKRGFVMGSLHQEGWGATLGYPGIRLGPPKEKITGYLFISDQLDRYWDTLDAFEGEAYTRVPIKVTLMEDQTEVDAFIYALQ